MAETYHGFIDTAHDALIIFEACNKGILPRVQRRFSDRERRTIRSGAVYVWDEEETGMRRWTDGRTWSPSRVHGCFLIYYELEGRRPQFVSRNGGSGGGRGARNSPRNGLVADSGPRGSMQDPSPPSIMQKEQGLIKKALSLCTNDKRKLHLVCYYSREDVERGCLASPKNDSRLSGLQVYEDMYPEIGLGLGRADRNGGRGRSSARQWNAASPDRGSVGREGPPAYVRSSMAQNRKLRPSHGEVYRYPSYGPYPGPVRHVIAPTGHLQPKRPTPSYDAATNTQTSSPPMMLQPSPETPTVQQQQYLHSQGQANVAAPAAAGQGAPVLGSQMPTPTPYPHHSHSYLANTWMTAPLASTATYMNQSMLPQPRPVPSTSHLSGNHSPAYFFSAPASTRQPVWQHREPPRSYTDTHSSSSRHESHRAGVPLQPGAWDGGKGGLMIHMAEASSSRTPSGPQPHALNHSTPLHSFNNNQQPRPHPPPLNRLSSIEGHEIFPSNSLAKGALENKKQLLPSVTSLIADNSTSARMNSEDVRQLASLRFKFQ